MKSEADSTKSKLVVVHENGDNSLSCNEIFLEIGGVGPYQLVIGIVIGIAMMQTSIDMFSFIFASTIPEHRLVIEKKIQKY